MSKATAIFDGFVGHNGKNVQIIAGSIWNPDNSVVRAHPDKFDITGDSAPKETAEQRVARLRAELAAAEAESASATEEDDDGGAAVGSEGTVDRVDDDIPPYAEWKLADLQAECRDRSLSSSGTKAELAARLDQWDAEHPE